MWTAWLRSPHSMAGGAAGNSVALGADGASDDDGPAVTLERITVGVEKFGALSVSSPQFADTREVTSDNGEPFFVANGPSR